MNVLFLSELFYPHRGGAELATYLYAKLLDESGFHVTVITNKFLGESAFSKVGNIRVYRRALFDDPTNKYLILNRVDFLFSGLMRKFVKWADLIYIPRFWYSAILLAKAYRKPAVVHLHDYTPVCPLSNLYQSYKECTCSKSNNLICPPKCIYSYETNAASDLVRSLASTVLNSTFGPSLGRLVTLSDAVICVSKAHQALIMERAHFLKNKTFIVYNPLPEIPYTEMNGDDFGYFGGPGCLKGFNVLRDALTHLDNKKMRIHATNFSDESSLRGPSAQYFMLYKHLDKPAFETLWKKIRAVVVPSIWQEPLPYIVSEAMLRGRIVIASKVGGIPEQTDKCKGAFLCGVGNYEELAKDLELVNGLERNDALELGMRNRETFLKRFNNETTTKEFINVFQTVSA